MSFIVKAPIKLFKAFKPRRIAKPIKLKRNDVRNLKFTRHKRRGYEGLFQSRNLAFTDMTPEEAEGPPCRDGNKCSNIRL